MINPPYDSRELIWFVDVDGKPFGAYRSATEARIVADHIRGPVVVVRCARHGQARK